MFGNGWRRARTAALAGIGVSLMLGAGLLGATGAGAATGAASPQAPSLEAGVPWSSVGAGWVLTEYQAAKGKPVTLEVVSPKGTRYPVHTWSASRDSLASGLFAWSGDKTRALFINGSYSDLAQLNLRTGKLATIRLPENVTPDGYTRPAGQQLLVIRYKGSTAALDVYSLAGRLVRTVATQPNAISAIQSANGATFAVSGTGGLRLVSSDGRLLRSLRVPGTDAAFGCSPVRWWTAAEVLASCDIKAGKTSRTHLELVPVSGAAPKQLTPARTKGTDLGDLDAWRLTSGLYLQSAGACGQLEINKQAANGSVTPVTVPGVRGDSFRVVTATKSALLVFGTGCRVGGQLVWYNPGTRAERWIFRGGAGPLVPYPGPGNGF
jgi:hypothetical protein